MMSCLQLDLTPAGSITNDFLVLKNAKLSPSDVDVLHEHLPEAPKLLAYNKICVFFGFHLSKLVYVWLLSLSTKPVVGCSSYF